MAHFRPSVTQAAVVLLGLLVGGEAPRAATQAPPDADRPKKSVYGKLQSVDKKANGLIMVSDEGQRLAWQFKPPVIAEAGRFKPGDPMIVIYRQVSPSDKRVTAVAFPGTATVPTYVNLTGSRVTLRSAPMVDGACGLPNAGPVQQTTIAAGALAEVAEACWCCASADETCSPGNKTGVGRALLVYCFE